MHDLHKLALTALLGSTLCASWAATAQSSSGSSKQLADLYTQMQQLQRETMELRGVIEEQAYRIRKLERQRVEDYQNIDKRLQELGAGSAPARSSAPPPKANSSTRSSSGAAAATGAAAAGAAAGALTAPAGGEREAYQHAYQLLKSKQLPEAERAYRQFLQDYPNGQFSANAYYWLGMLYLESNSLNQAKQSFATLVERYPGHRKAPEATYKLAGIYRRQGDSIKARNLLNQIVSDYGATAPDTVRKANADLDKYFR